MLSERLPAAYPLDEVTKNQEEKAKRFVAFCVGRVGKKQADGQTANEVGFRSAEVLYKQRLSCQALCDHDIKLRVLLTVTSTGLDGPGPHPESHITPEPEWVDKPA